MKREELFNPKGYDFDERLCPVRFLAGEDAPQATGLITIFSPLHPAIYDFVKLQKQRLWKADEYPIDRTKERFDELSEQDRRVFEYILSFLAFLDSVQVSNLADISVVYQLGEYRLWGATHSYFEAEHAIAYSNILYGLFNGDFNEVKRIFYLAKDFPELRRRNELIAKEYQRLFDLFQIGVLNVPPAEYAEILTRVFSATYAMEAVTFYMGFKAIEFYQYKYGVLPMTNKVISEIKADELFHVKVMASIIKNLRPFLEKYLSPETIDEIILSTIHSFVEADLQFYQAVLADNSFGISQRQIEEYIKFLADKRAKLVGVSPLYGVTSNPFDAIDRLYGFLDSHNNSAKKEAFFETKSSAYVSTPINMDVLENESL